MILENTTSMPILGYYDNNAISAAKKLSEAYNKSVVNLNPHKFLGFDLELPRELKQLRGRLNKDDRVLEIHFNENTTLIVPSVYSNLVTTRKYFEISGESNSLLEVSSLDESILLKGKAGGKKAFKAGMKSAKKFFTRDVEVKNPNDIRGLAENISSDLNKILGGEVLKKKEFVDFVKEFIENPHKGRSIDKLYQKMFDSAIQTKNVDKVISAIAKRINQNRSRKGMIKGMTAISELKEDISSAYSIDFSEINKRSESDESFPKIKNAISIVKNMLKGLVRALKAAISGGVGYMVASKGVIATLIKIAEFIVYKGLSLFCYAIGLDINTVDSVSEFSDRFSQIKGSILDQIASGAKLFGESILGVVSGLTDIVSSKLQVTATWLESLPFLENLKIPIICLLVIYFVMNLKAMFKHIIAVKKIRSIGK